MNRIRGTKIRLLASEPLTTQDQIDQWFRNCGVDGQLEGIRQIIADLESRNDVDQEQLLQASGLLNEADQRWQQILEIKRVLENSLELSSNEQWLQKVSAQPTLRNALETIFAPEVRTVYLKKLFEELNHLTETALRIIYTESAEVGIQKGIVAEIQEGKERAGGSKGGKKDKRKPWAVKTAARLVKKTKGDSRDEAWDKLPGSRSPWLFEFGGEFDVQVYRDGDKLVAVNSATKQPIGKGELKKSSFLKEYYRPAKNSGK